MTVVESLLLASFRDLLPTASSKVRLIEGGVNNMPDDHSHRASMDIYDLLQSLTEDDLVLALISGMPYNSYFRYGLNDMIHSPLIFSSVNELSHSPTNLIYVMKCGE